MTIQKFDGDDDNIPRPIIVHDKTHRELSKDEIDKRKIAERLEIAGEYTVRRSSRIMQDPDRPQTEIPEDKYRIRCLAKMKASSAK